MQSVYTLSVAGNVAVGMDRDDFFRELFKFSLSSKKKSRGGMRVVDICKAREELRAWAFVADDRFEVHKSCKTRATFEAYTAWGEYFTPNGFYNRHRREKRWLRHLNAMFVDIDMEITPAEVMDIIGMCRLPVPSAIVRTPGGGCHVYWLLDKPVPGTAKAIRFFEMIQRDLTFVLSGDFHAVGAERLMRIPSLTLTHYWDLDKRYRLEDFRTWRDLYLPDHKNNDVKTYFSGSHPGVKLLLEGVEEGRRNCSAFALSLHFKCLGMGYDWTLDRLSRWNALNSPPLPGQELAGVVGRVYRIDKYCIYPQRKLSVLSGVVAKAVIRTAPKPREQRERVHFSERVDDALALIKRHGGIYSTSVRRFASALGCSRSTMESVLGLLKSMGCVTIRVLGNGCKQRTVLVINEKEGDFTEISEKTSGGILSQSGVHVSCGGWVGALVAENPLFKGG